MTLWPGWVQAGDLQVVVTNVRNDQGKVMVGVCSVSTFLGEQCQHNGSALSQRGQTVVTVSDVPPGTWAVQAYLDENENETADQNFIGIPTEGIGCSNNAPFRFGPPKWADAAFQLGAEGGLITLRLRYFN